MNKSLTFKDKLAKFCCMNDQEKEFSFDDAESRCEVESYSTDEEKRVKEPNKNAVINTTEINKNQNSLGI